MSISVWDVLDNCMVQPELVKDQRWVNLYPSEASAVIKNKWGEEEVIGTCQRKAWLRFKTMEQQNKDLTSQRIVLQINDDDLITMPTETKEARTEWIFEEGRRIEKTILDVAVRAGVCVEGHRKFLIPIGSKLFLSGELDGIFKIQDQLIGVEIKSVSGYIAERDIFGTAAQRKNGTKGAPKWQHLLQTAVYAWHYRKIIPSFKILYFMRGSSIRTEFYVEAVENESTGDFDILVDGRSVGLTIGNIVKRYEELGAKLESNTLPDREFDILYDDEKMNLLSKRNLLNKTNKIAWDKYWERVQDSSSRQIKRPEDGDFECNFCPYKKLCYDQDRKPIDYGPKQ